MFADDLEGLKTQMKTSPIKAKIDPSIIEKQNKQVQIYEQNPKRFQ